MTIWTRARSHLTAIGTLALAGALGVSLSITLPPSAPATALAASPDAASASIDVQPADLQPADAAQGSDELAETGLGAALAIVPAAAGATWSRHVWTKGGQAAIDRCKGAVKVPFTNGYAVVAEHNYCGGAWILKVRVGQTVRLTGTVSGTFKAVATRNVTRGASSASLVGLGTSGFVLQTCYFNSNKMRLVGLTRIATPKPAPKKPAAKKVVKKAPTCAGLRATIVGSSKSNRIRGTNGRDVIVAGSGNDWIDGRGGNDVICGGNGNDTIYGGSGADLIYGGSGNDRVWGGSGNDRIYGQTGRDTMTGGAGSDKIWGTWGYDRFYK